VLNDEAVVQPSLTVEKGGFSLNTWGNYNLTDGYGADQETDFGEIDLTIAYSCDVGPFSVGAGYIEYLFPHQAGEAGIVQETAEDGTIVDVPVSKALEGTKEVYASVSYNDLPVTPALNVYYDIDAIEGFYANLSLGYEAELGESLALGLSGSIGFANSDYNEGYFGVDDDALNDANLGATLSYAVSKDLSLVPGVTYTWFLDSDIETAAEGIYQDKDQVVGSLKASYTF
jgi:hypothetical protein